MDNTLSGTVHVLAVLRQMQANSSHFRNGLPVLADHHDGEYERELAAIAAVATLVDACQQIKHVRNRPSAARIRSEAWRKFNSALERVGGAK